MVFFVAFVAFRMALLVDRFMAGASLPRGKDRLLSALLAWAVPSWGLRGAVG
jgi:hypothetical protein